MTPNAGKKNLPGFRIPRPNQPLALQPTIVNQPQTYLDLQNGIAQLMVTIRPTLGPLPRLVALSRTIQGDGPEILDDGAQIARRIIQVAPRGEDVGAMLLRHALWRMHKEAGDGSATMAVIYQTILNEGIRAITQGGCNAMLLRAGLEKGLKEVQKALQQNARPLLGKSQIAQFARGLVQEQVELANILGEVFDIVGSDGLVVVEKGNRLGVEREYIDGTYWHLSGWFSRLFVTESALQQTTFEDTALLISDLAISDPNQLVPLLDHCLKAEVRRLVIIAKEISDRAIGLLVKNNQAKSIQTMVVRTPRVLEMDQVASMEDIAILSGGRPFYAAAYQDFHDFQLSDLGYARRAWATQSLFGLFGGKGDPRRIRQHIQMLRGLLKSATDDHEKEKLRQRLGRVAGGTAIVRVGDATNSATDALKTLTLRAVETLRHALNGGVVTGGGVALLRASLGVAVLPAANNDEAIAFAILQRALEEPLRTLVENAGHSASWIVEQLKSSANGYGFDVRTGQFADMQQIGVLDSLFILNKALEIAVGGAAQALTTDVIVHHKKPQECIEP